MEHNSLDRVLPIKEFVRRYPNMGSEASVRFQIFRAKANKLDDYGAILRVGRKVLIDVDGYMNWLLSHKAETKN